MRSLRSFEVEPWLRSAGQQVWTRIRKGLGSQEQELQESLRREVELLGEVRTNVQRATQLARVLDAVYALAEAHEFTEAQLAALRARPMSRAESVMELAKKLETRAVQVIEQMLGGEGPQARAPQTALTVRADGSGLEALVSWLTPRIVTDARPASRVERSRVEAPRSAASRAGQAAARTRVSTPTGARTVPNERAELKGTVRQAAPRGAAVQSASSALVVPPPSAAGVSDSVLNWLRSDVTADLRFARAGMDAARASLQVSSNELSLRLRITHQAALDAAQWFSRRRRNELALWLLSKGTQLVIRKVVLPQLARTKVGPQLLLQVALASGATGTTPLIARLPRRLRRDVTRR